MLWIPVKRKPKKLRILVRFTIRLILFVMIFLGLGTASVPPEHALSVQIDQVTRPHQFDFINWETEAVASEIGRRWSPPAIPAGMAEQGAMVQTFLDRERRRNELEGEINQRHAKCPASTLNNCSAREQQQVETLKQELAIIEKKQNQIIPLVETILSRQVEAVLQAEGFTVGGQAFPPVAFRLIDPPTALILSPRDRIEKQHFRGLQPGLDNNQRAGIETVLDERGDVSSYVTDVGGLASYPAMVINHDWLPSLIEIIAHEWIHNYFYTIPSNIGWGYQTYPRLTTINETTASIVGEEISRKVITRFYPDLVDQLPPLDEIGQPVPDKPSDFDLAMRRIRQQVDQLLAEGKIEAAERFMETERLKLVDQGYNLRKLNQAYFAFHGSYATSPASIDPTGDQLRQLRAASPSLKTFLSRVSWLDSYEDYLAWLAEAGLDPAGQRSATRTAAE